MIPRYFIVAERDHEIQNPISEEKLRLLDERLGLGPGSRVLDAASGRGGPALRLAREFGCRVEGIEIAPEFQPPVRRGGHGVVGEPFWRTWPLPDDYEDRTGPLRTYLRHGRDHLGWAIFVGRKRPA